MRKFRTGNVYSPLGAANRYGLSKPPLKLSTGIAILAIFCVFFVVLDICRGQSATPQYTTSPSTSQVNPPSIQPPGTNSNPGSNPGPGSEPAPESAPNAPAHVRVVRLSYVLGSVQVMRGGQTEFSQAVMNMPILQGSQIDTGPDGRAEIEFEDGSVARITPNSSLDISRLALTADGAFNTTVEQRSGLIYYELRSDPKSTYHVAFGGNTADPTVDSTFRINLGAAPPELAVIDGAVQVRGAESAYTAQVRQNQTIDFGSSNGSKYTVADGIIPNGFDQWNDQRDEEAAQEAKNQTPARVQQGGGGGPMGSLIGYGWGDLDNAGGWYPLPGYGMVWQPYGVGPGFDPYGYGMWANYGGLGYTWISGYPWGWLPFHCGLWSDIGGFGWGWMPGYGCGGGFGIGFGYGYGGYGYGGYGWYGRRHPHHGGAGNHGGHPYTNIARAPAGYHAPVPPAAGKGAASPSIVHVGSKPQWMRNAAMHSANFRATGDNARRGRNSTRSIHFDGSKVAPLHSMTAGMHVPVRNAALFNSSPARSFQTGFRGELDARNSTLGRGPGFHGEEGIAGLRGTERMGNTRARRGSVGALRGPMSTSRTEAFNGSRRAGFGGRNFGDVDHAAFGQHTSFGPHGSFGGVHSAFSNRGAFRSGAGRSGGFAGGGFHGGGGFSHASSSGGFHGGGGGGFHGGGGGFSGGGGGHAGGGGGGGHSGH